MNLKNRMVVSPMCQYSSVDGFANDWHLVHLDPGRLVAQRLFSLKLPPFLRKGELPRMIWEFGKMSILIFLKRITDFIKQHNSVPGIQLAHAGRKASHLQSLERRKILQSNEGAWQTLAPSAIAL